MSSKFNEIYENSIKNPEKDIPEIVQEHLIHGKNVERGLIKL